MGEQNEEESQLSLQKEHSRGKPEKLNPEEKRKTSRKRRGRTNSQKGRVRIRSQGSQRIMQRRTKRKQTDVGEERDPRKQRTKVLPRRLPRGRDPVHLVLDSPLTAWLMW